MNFDHVDRKDVCRFININENTVIENKYVLQSRSGADMSVTARSHLFIYVSLSFCFVSFGNYSDIGLWLFSMSFTVLIVLCLFFYIP